MIVICGPLANLIANCTFMNVPSLTNYQYIVHAITARAEAVLHTYHTLRWLLGTIFKTPGQPGV